MSELTLWLIRHGESTANFGEWSDTPYATELTSNGLMQAKETAEKITIRPDLIIVSPYRRAHQSASPIINRYRDVPVETWAIQEFTYLSPTRLKPISISERKTIINSFWQRCDPHFEDGEGTESFANFILRVKEFHEQLQTKSGFIIAVGHGQFFKAFHLNLTHDGFSDTQEWMSLFRQQETAKPIANSEILKLCVINK